MKLKIFIPLFAAIGLVMFPSCEEDYTEATAPHEYGEFDNPPLKGSDASNYTDAVTLKQGNTDWVYMDLNNAKSNIESQLGATIDEVFAGIGNGTYRFLMVNNARRLWDKTPADAEGIWYVSQTGICCAPENAAAKVKFDAASRTVAFALTPNAPGGAMIPVTFGIARTDNSALPVNVRFQQRITVSDLSLCEVEGIMPAGDYNGFELLFADIMPNLEFALGITSLDGFAEAIDPNGKALYDLYVINDNGERTSGYTANGMGYWLNAAGQICTWGADGFSFFVEAMTQYENGYVGPEGVGFMVGRAPGIEPGTVFTTTMQLVSKREPQKCLTLVIKATAE